MNLEDMLDRFSRRSVSDRSAIADKWRGTERPWAEPDMVHFVVGVAIRRRREFDRPRINDVHAVVFPPRRDVFFFLRRFLKRCIWMGWRTGRMDFSVRAKERILEIMKIVT